MIQNFAATRKTIVFAIASCLAVGGCVADDVSSDASISTAGDIPELRVMLIDRTEGMKIFIPARQVAERLIREANPGMEFKFRFISDRSYARDQLIATLNVPRTVAEPAKNRYDVRGERAYRAATQAHRVAVARVKLAAIEALRSYECIEATQSTDLKGAIQSAAEAFAAVGNGHTKTLIAATDLGDNMNFDDVSPDLGGVTVIIYLLTDEIDPGRVQVVKQHWTQEFEAWGATNVEFPYFETQKIDGEALKCAR